MKKSELKSVIKECVREVILEEGILSGIVSEVVQGLGQRSVVQESIQNSANTPSAADIQRVAETKKKMLAAVAENSYAETKKKFSNPEYFEGTRPLREGKRGNPLSGTAPGDAGVDISNIPGFGSWSSVAAATRK